MVFKKELHPAATEKPGTRKGALRKVKPTPVAPSKVLSRGPLTKVNISKLLPPSKEHDAETRSSLAKWVLLGISPFVGLMIYIVVAAPDHGARFDALKFLLPSVVSILTLVLGYYFGQQGRR